MLTVFKLGLQKCGKLLDFQKFIFTRCSAPEYASISVKLELILATAKTWTGTDDELKTVDFDWLTYDKDNITEEFLNENIDQMDELDDTEKENLKNQTDDILSNVNEETTTTTTAAETDKYFLPVDTFILFNN